jgi:DNA-binding XRE family transcriptional regulator
MRGNRQGMVHGRGGPAARASVRHTVSHSRAIIRHRPCSATTSESAAAIWSSIRSISVAVERHRFSFTRTLRRALGLLSAAQIRAGRHLADLSQADVAKATGLSLPTIKRAESEREVSVSDEAIASIRAAIEAKGVEFTNGDRPGVRMRKAPQSPITKN